MITVALLYHHPSTQQHKKKRSSKFSFEKMICSFAESNMCNFTLILFTCIWIPVLRATQSVLIRLFSFVLNPHNTPFQESPLWELDLPASRFLDSGFCSKNGGGEPVADQDNEHMCSICLMEFEKEDLVNELPRCGHVFHVDCMEKWLDRFQFTCPLCRSLVLQTPSSPCKMWDDSAVCVLPSDLDR